MPTVPGASSLERSRSDRAMVANFDPPGGFIAAPLRGVLDGTVGSANGTTSSERINRYVLGTGVFSQGVPRAVEVGMRLTLQPKQILRVAVRL